MNVFGHQDVGINPRQMPRTDQLQHVLDRPVSSRSFQKRQTVITAERDEVQRLRMLESF